VNPYFTTTNAAERLNIAFTTAQRAIGKLEAAGIIAQTSERKRDRIYCATQILGILEEPTKIKEKIEDFPLS
jgi:ribosomal protein S25